MKKNIIFWSIFLVFLLGCENTQWEIPENFNPVVIGKSTIGEGLISYKLEILPPKLLRYSGVTRLPVKKESDVFVKLAIKFDKSISVFKKDQYIDFVDPSVTIVTEKKNYTYKLYPYMTSDGFFYGTQLIFPEKQDKYTIKLTIKKKDDTVINNSIKSFFRKIPFFVDGTYENSFKFYISMLYF